MIHQKLIQPESIVVVGGSENVHSPGGSVLKNLLDHHYSGNLYVVNPKKEKVQGIKSYQSISEIPKVDVAIIAIAARFVYDAVKVLTEEKETMKSVLKSEFGLFKKDSTVKQMKTNPKNEDFEFIIYEEESDGEIKIDSLPNKSRNKKHSNKLFEKLKQQAIRDHESEEESDFE